ncbi:MAG: hypothetical protein GXP62_08185 [Oligoflexia bacterium]|nr:hypothetical protein [Oligoflexia bacterium]
MARLDLSISLLDRDESRDAPHPTVSSPHLRLVPSPTNADDEDTGNDLLSAVLADVATAVLNAR